MKIIDISNCSDGVIAYINNLQKYKKKKKKEIQDLKQKNDYLNDLEASAVEYKELKNHLQQKETIIKEVREKIHDIWFKIDFTNMTSMSYVTIKLDETSQGNELLEILDKEVN